MHLLLHHTPCVGHMMPDAWKVYSFWSFRHGECVHISQYWPKSVQYHLKLRQNWFLKGTPSAESSANFPAVRKGDNRELLCLLYLPCSFVTPQLSQVNGGLPPNHPTVKNNWSVFVVCSCCVALFPWFSKNCFVVACRPVNWWQRLKFSVGDKFTLHVCCMRPKVVMDISVCFLIKMCFLWRGHKSHNPNYTAAKEIQFSHTFCLGNTNSQELNIFFWMYSLNCQKRGECVGCWVQMFVGKQHHHCSVALGKKKYMQNLVVILTNPKIFIWINFVHE